MIFSYIILYFSVPLSKVAYHKKGKEHKDVECPFKL